MHPNIKYVTKKGKMRFISIWLHFHQPALEILILTMHIPKAETNGMTDTMYKVSKQKC